MKCDVSVQFYAPTKKKKKKKKKSDVRPETVPEVLGCHGDARKTGCDVRENKQWNG